MLQPRTSIGTPVGKSLDPSASLVGYAALLARPDACEAIDETAARLVDAAIAMSMRPGFDEFVSLAHLRFVPFPTSARGRAARVEPLARRRDLG